MTSTTLPPPIAVAVMLTGCSADSEGIPQQAREPVTTAAELVVASMLQAPEQIVGRRVELQPAPAQAVSHAAVLVGPMRSHSVLVVPVDSRMIAGIDVGDDVMVTGTVKHMPPPTWALAGVSPEPLVRGARLAGVKTYVEAVKLDTLPKPDADQPPAT
jgi:hypothetical protein